MARTRVIDRNAVLDAVQTVVTRDGAAHMTIEAVAAEAKISKASVLYDYKTKNALIKAVIERRLEAEVANIRAAMEKLGPVPDGAIRGRIAVASRSVSDEDRAVALNLCAALAQDAEFRKPIQAYYRDQIAEIVETSEQPRGALLAFLAIEGMQALERLDLHLWPPGEREALIAEIAWLAGQRPERASDHRAEEPS